MVLYQQRLTAHEIPNHWISSRLILVLKIFRHPSAVTTVIEHFVTLSSEISWPKVAWFSKYRRWQIGNSSYRRQDGGDIQIESSTGTKWWPIPNRSQAYAFRLVKWDASSRWSSESHMGSIETISTGKTHPTLQFSSIENSFSTKIIEIFTF